MANNGLVFVYGNTGTGKTYSMGLLDLMDDSKNGLVPDALRYLFGMLSNLNASQRGAATRAIASLYPSARSTWTRYTTSSPWKVRPNCLSGKIQYSRTYAENQGAFSLESDADSSAIAGTGLPDH